MVCRSVDRARIELLKAGGASSASLAKKFDVSEDAIQRHWKSHVSNESKSTFLAGPGALETWAQKAGAESDSILDYLRLLRTSLTAQLTACSDAGDTNGVATVSHALTKVLAAIGKVTGEVSTLSSLTVNQNINLAESADFMKAQRAILKALQAHPAARADVVKALQALDLADAPVASPGHPQGRLIELRPNP